VWWRGERSTAGLAGAGLLDAGTRFFGDSPDFADLPVTARTARLEWRRWWVEQALAPARAPSASPGNIVDQSTPYEGWNDPQSLSPLPQEPLCPQLTGS
jgi:hypothetical protein